MAGNGIGRRFPRDSTPALCLAPCHPTGLGLTEERRGNNARRPSRAGRRVPEPARGRGAVPPPPPRPERGPCRAGGLGELPHPSAAARPLQWENPKHLRESHSPAALGHRAAGAASPPCRAVPRVLGRFHSSAASGTLQGGQSPAPAGAPRSQAPGQAKTPRGRRRLPPRRSLPSLCTPALGAATSGQQKLPSG